ncbi:MAG: hypothetical protein QF704_11550, partial [Anaerolineales bacterium]|nr:hypothetical protein [Anaerolineales bacterium]
YITDTYGCPLVNLFEDDAIIYDSGCVGTRGEVNECITFENQDINRIWSFVLPNCCGNTTGTVWYYSLCSCGCNIFNCRGGDSGGCCGDQDGGHPGHCCISSSQGHSEEGMNCFVMAQGVCASEGGTWGGGPCDCNSCGNSASDVRGGCCYNDGSCFIKTAGECGGSGGTYFGCYSTCPPPLPACTSLCSFAGEGACCVGETCSNETYLGCFYQGGQWHGDGVQCSDVDCSTPLTGACCIGSECFYLTDTICLSFGGIYMGDGEYCTDDCTSSKNTGSCCIGGNCFEQYESLCSFNGGEYGGDGSTCSGVTCDGADTGSCCIDSTCIITTSVYCAAKNGTWTEGGYCKDVDCLTGESVGACCILGSCFEIGEDECIFSGGNYYGNGSVCTDADVSCDGIMRGACCLPCAEGDACECSMETPQSCATVGGSFIGYNTDCVGANCLESGKGACCLSDGSCLDNLDSVECDAFGGEFNPQVSCDTGVCDLTGGCC